MAHAENCTRGHTGAAASSRFAEGYAGTGVTQRGNNRQDVFFTDADRDVYLELLSAQCETFGLSIEGYCTAWRICAGAPT